MVIKKKKLLENLNLPYRFALFPGLLPLRSPIPTNSRVAPSNAGRISSDPPFWPRSLRPWKSLAETRCPATTPATAPSRTGPQTRRRTPIAQSTVRRKSLPPANYAWSTPQCVLRVLEHEIDAPRKQPTSQQYSFERNVQATGRKST